MNTVEFGRIGEEYAAGILQKIGLTVIAQNYHSRFGEIDIIAVNEQYIVFAEVKTRVQGCLGVPADAVGLQKQRRIIKTAAHYLISHPVNLQPRFDVVEIITSPIGEVISSNHFANAFCAQSSDIF